MRLKYFADKLQKGKVFRSQDMELLKMDNINDGFPETKFQWFKFRLKSKFRKPVVDEALYPKVHKDGKMHSKDVLKALDSIFACDDNIRNKGHRLLYHLKRGRNE